MNYLTCDKLTLSRGAKLLFEELSFSIESKDKIAIVGLNGCGKSSLLQIIAGRLTADAGVVTKNSSVHIHLMDQMPEYDPEQTLLEYVFSSFSIPHTSTILAYELASEALHLLWSEEKQAELDTLSAEMDRLGAWEFEGKLASILGRFNVHGLQRKMAELSGGMIRKLSLAQVVLAEPDLLILDEPTNHLDIDTILWLQDYLNKWNKAFVIVTHDRYFLDQVCNMIWEIDEERFWTYRGNFTNYLEKKQERLEAQARKSVKTQNILRSELEWMRRTPCARGTKQKARLERVDQMLKIGTLKEQSRAEMSVSGRRLGKKIVDFQNVTFAYPSIKIVSEFSYCFKRNEKIGLVGLNGVGKTTFLKLLTGEIEPLSGYVDRGVNTDFGVFSQTPLEMPAEMPILKYLRTFAEIIETKQGEKITAGQMLERFLFPARDHYKPIEKLSGGEKRRLQLLTVLIQNPNFLILDEPTNDLDIHTLSVLEEFLLEFQGSLILVSHDRFFLDRVCDYLLVIEGEGRIVGFPSHYSDYLLYVQEAKRQAKIDKPVEVVVKEVLSTDKKKKLTYNEQREYEQIESVIMAIEEEVQLLEQRFSTAQPAEFEELQKVYSLKKEELEKSMLRWEELEEKVSNN